MFKNKFEPNDFHAYPSYNKIVTNIKGNIKIVTSMFHIVLKNIVFSTTFAINPDQGKTCVVSQK